MGFWGGKRSLAPRPPIGRSPTDQPCAPPTHRCPAYLPARPAHQLPPRPPGSQRAGRPLGSILRLGCGLRSSGPGFRARSARPATADGDMGLRNKRKDLGEKTTVFRRVGRTFQPWPVGVVLTLVHPRDSRSPRETLLHVSKHRPSAGLEALEVEASA